MSGVYAFRCGTAEHPLPTSSLVVFGGPTRFVYADLVSAIAAETRRALAPEAVYLIYPSSICRDVVAALREDESAFDPLAADTIIGVYGYAPDGSVSRVDELRRAAPAQPDLAALRRQGLTILFNRRGGLLDSGPTAHFVKPSGTPDSRFLRASHALAEGAEIFFVAFWLLGFLGEDIEFIHLDTAAIASVPLAALLMQGRLVAPTIRTFSSYQGLATHPFNVDRPDLVIISASQSGTMAAEIMPKVKDSRRIVTLFSTSDVPPGTSMLCDLRRDAISNLLGCEPTRRTPGPAHTRSIRLIGEHFIAETEPARSIIPGTAEAPPVVKDKIAKLQGCGVFTALRSGEAIDQRRAIWVDIPKLRTTDVFTDWIKTVAAREIPASTRAIIHPDDDLDALSIATALKDEISRQGGTLSDMTVLKLSDIEGEATAPWPEPRSPVVVVVGATGRGERLLAASRALRRYAPHSHRIFLAATTMPSSKQAFSLLNSNLKHPSHRFHSMFEVFIDRRTAAQSWRDERAFLLDHDDDLPSELVTRLDALGGSPDGLADALFLEGARGPLRLADNFAFWPVGTSCGDASQADVFISMAAILENLRSGDVVVGKRLINDVQTHSVLSAEAFSRYNDGVIQAALVRAALPIELDYRDAPDDSRLIADLVAQMLDRPDALQADALAEFLLALVLERLKLVPEHLVFVVERSATARLTPIQRWLADGLRDALAKAA
ncbi:hypothetical protein [Sphingosinicella sp. LY1275]|uniref:hypothetical protein n=1 Tax=Sphingosinicella sp. LY1275 TaxID=3095379 RepID=UPI002ADEB13D|nr:hypothetical protein [Sphingosinicella sp. LY1275]MEA1015333.1 hypothetical protein [Sphingosinicella sp. LY1275]